MGGYIFSADAGEISALERNHNQVRVGLGSLKIFHKGMIEKQRGIDCPE